ncbi:kelch-like protein 10 [Phlebotomus argentipes]|uniref:kelch-like protein 10 n=1 Tax=Phlebotomus argentipes TaxID=94469 RepID=UPI002892C45A|nr:kelch-like protein 10 [Phlebotomus argentipes]
MPHMKEFAKYREHNMFIDAILKLDHGQILPIHRVVLSQKSEFFQALFINALRFQEKSSKTQEYEIHGIRYEILKKVLKYIYEDDLSLDSEDIFELLSVADYLLVDGLVDKCKSFLKNSLNTHNCVKVLLFSESRFQKDLEEAAFQFIIVDFVKVMNENQDLYDLDFGYISKILASDWLNVKNEIVVWNACVKWIEKSKEEREGMVYQLLQYVRMGLMNIEEIQRNMEQNSLIVKCEEANLLLKRVYEFLTTAKLSQEILQCKLAQPRLPHEVIFTVGGWSEGSAKMEIETYDTRADRWVRISNDDPFGPRAYHGSVAIEGRIYCVGGFNGREYFSNCRIFDTVTKCWLPMAPMHMRRCYVSVALLDGMIYAMGGYDGHGRQRSCEKYDLRTNQWTVIAPMNAQRSDACACVLDGSIYILGGFNGQECLNTAEVYDAERDTWSMIPHMNQRRSGLKCIAHRGRIYAIGGFNGLVRLRHCEQYNPATEEWDAITDMISPRSNFAIEVIDDMIFAMAGFNGTFTISDVECYAPECNEWMMVTSMNIVRSALTANIIRYTPNIEEYLYPCRAELVEEHRQAILSSDTETE